MLAGRSWFQVVRKQDLHAPFHLVESTAGLYTHAAFRSGRRLDVRFLALEGDVGDAKIVSVGVCSAVFDAGGSGAAKADDERALLAAAAGTDVISNNGSLG